MKLKKVALALCLALAAVQCAHSEDASPDADIASLKTPTPTFREGSEKMPFQAEVNRLMDIIVHSLYSNKDIFLRELISNSADALDKVRFMSLTDPTALGEGTAKDLPLEIKISVDEEKGTITIRDTGVGMTREELISNLGTIARSGTAAFLEQMQKGGDLNLIGQFGVGFYSVYLVADYVEVVTKHANDKQWIWESTASGEFAISEDKENEPLGRGTLINIHLKDEAFAYVNEAKLRELVAKYSEFIQFPINMWVERDLDEEVPLEGAELEEALKKQEEESDPYADEDEENSDSKAEKTPKKLTKTVTERKWVWDVLNDSKALWLRPPGNVSKEEYVGFYKVLQKLPDTPDPMSYSHFSAEGDVDFKAVLYLPGTAPHDMYDSYYTKKPNIKMYVRRVFISDSMEELMPKWLSFVVGIVDSDSMPLNVSREMLQLVEGMKVIRKKLTRKAIEMIRKLSDAEEKARDDVKEGADADAAEKKGWFGKKKAADKAEEDTSEAKAQREADKKQYSEFWRMFGKAVKMGIIEDTANRNRLMPLLRFRTSASNRTITSLEAYMSRMKPNQTQIYYLINPGGIEELERSPFSEALTSRGYEVIYLIDALDEYMMAQVTEHEDKKMINAAKDEIKLDETDDEKEKAKRAAFHYKGLASWWKKVIDDPSINVIKVSRRLASAPCVVVTGKYGWSAAMEKIARSQTLGESERTHLMRGSRTLEINPRHPVVRKLRDGWVSDPSDPNLKANARVLFDTCMLESGFVLDDPKSHNDRVMRLLGADFDVEDLAPLPEEEYPEVPEDPREKKRQEALAKQKAAPATRSIGADGKVEFEVTAEQQAAVDAELAAKRAEEIAQARAEAKRAMEEDDDDDDIKDEL